MDRRRLPERKWAAGLEPGTLLDQMERKELGHKNGKEPTVLGNGGKSSGGGVGGPSPLVVRPVPPCGGEWKVHC